MAQKLQDIKDAAKVQEAAITTTPRKATDVSTEDGEPIEMKGSTNAEQVIENPVMGDDARSVAGRKTMLKGGEAKDLHSGKEAPIAVDREKEKYPAGKKPEKEAKMESQEDHEVEMELNSILKKGPSKFISLPCTKVGQLDNG